MQKFITIEFLTNHKKLYNLAKYTKEAMSIQKNTLDDFAVS